MWHWIGKLAAGHIECNWGPRNLANARQINMKKKWVPKEYRCQIYASDYNTMFWNSMFRISLGSSNLISSLNAMYFGFLSVGGLWAWFSYISGYSLVLYSVNLEQFIWDYCKFEVTLHQQVLLLKIVLKALVNSLWKEVRERHKPGTPFLWSGLHVSEQWVYIHTRA